ncbi:MAG: DUF4390 domain-containing protein [Gallionellaceae bacterium]|jgi:hypothetical protein|nr:DUF4390 domain-containing protein [Gallionellaceae bacterium]
MTQNSLIPAFFFRLNSVLGVALCALLLSFSSLARADRIEMQKVDARFVEGYYQVSASFGIHFTSVVEQALEQGVPLYFVSDFTLTRPRWYWTDEVVAQTTQTIKLSYNTLTRQYRITRGALFQNFSSLDEALRIIGYQPAEPVPANLLGGNRGYISEKLFGKDDSDYIAAVRLYLDVSQLPKPLQVNALTNDDWHMDSDWYRWIVSAGTVKRGRGE